MMVQLWKNDSMMMAMILVMMMLKMIMRLMMVLLVMVVMSCTLMQLHMQLVVETLMMTDPVLIMTTGCLFPSLYDSLAFSRGLRRPSGEAV